VTRIVAGVAKGRRIAVTPGQATRPTSDRAREALFSALESIRGGALEGARVLDLYAGSGAVGLEALSRGAAEVTLVESSPAAARICRENVRSLGLDGARVVRERVERFVNAPATRAYDVVFLDPPYAVASDEVMAVLGRLRDGWLPNGGVIVVERASRDKEWKWPDGYVADRCRRYGEATLWYGRAAGVGDRLPPEV
jgi:16S rRNA (guanine966-N2)-methyltransferase